MFFFIFQTSIQITLLQITITITLQTIVFFDFKIMFDDL